MSKNIETYALYIRAARTVWAAWIVNLAMVSLAFAERPNIVLLYADDMGYGDLAIQNPESKIPTPHLDQLAREGVRFTDAHSSSGICTPSRYALLTGRYHWRKFYGIVNSFGESVFDEARLTLPEMLREKGYRTACIGKWHLGWNWEALLRPGAQPRPIAGDARNRKAYAPDDFDWSRPIPDGPLDHGFDYYFGDDVPNFPPYTWIENDRVMIEPTEPLTETPPTAEGNWEARPGPMSAGWRLDQVMPTLTEKAVAWIAQQRGADEPFFLYFPFTSPHAPIVPTEEFEGTSQANGYGDFMVQTDATVGRVLEALEENGFRENTLVIFTSDNGPERYAYERVRRYEHRSMGALRGLKRDIWEGGHRIPFVIRWPGVVTPGRVSSALVSQVDLMATLAALVGHDLPRDAAEDSYNLLPLLKEDAPAFAGRPVHVHNTFADRYAIRRGDWALIDAKTGAHSRVPDWFTESEGYAANSHPAALYDLSSDLSQRRNLFAEHPQKVAELRTLLQHIRQQGHSAPRLEAE